MMDRSGQRRAAEGWGGGGVVLQTAAQVPASPLVNKPLLGSTGGLLSRSGLGAQIFLPPVTCSLALEPHGTGVGHLRSWRSWRQSPPTDLLTLWILLLFLLLLSHQLTRPSLPLHP